MRRILTLIIFLIYNPILFSQEKDSILVGEWKVIAIETHNYHYNSKTDSFNWSKNYKEMLPKLIKDFGYKNEEEFIESVKQQTTNDRFIFQKDGIYLRKKDNKILREGKYIINKSEKTISFKDKGKVEYKMDHFIKKGLLHLKMVVSKDKINPTKFILQKITIP